MLQDFRRRTTPDTGAPRLAALRTAMAAAGVDAFLVPRADAHQGENVAPRDERLAWLTGFTGSAGFAVVTPDRAAIFVDGRYRLQVRGQVDTPAFETRPSPRTRSPTGSPSLSRRRPARLRSLAPHRPRGRGRSLRRSARARSASRASRPSSTRSGRTSRPRPPARWRRTPRPRRPQLRRQARPIARGARRPRPRGGGPDAAGLHRLAAEPPRLDIARKPVALAFAILHADGNVALFTDPAKAGAPLAAHLGPDVAIAPETDFGPALDTLRAASPSTRPAPPPGSPSALAESPGAEVAGNATPAFSPRPARPPPRSPACAPPTLRDGAAMADSSPGWTRGTQGRADRDEVVRRLEGIRAARPARLQDISFETICGAGAHGAIVHYRVTEASDRPVRPGSSCSSIRGGQYVDGTTDITRTVAVGEVPEAAGADSRSS